MKTEVYLESVVLQGGLNRSVPIYHYRLSRYNPFRKYTRVIHVAEMLLELRSWDFWLTRNISCILTWDPTSSGATNFVIPSGCRIPTRHVDTHLPYRTHFAIDLKLEFKYSKRRWVKEKMNLIRLGERLAQANLIFLFMSHISINFRYGIPRLECKPLDSAST